MIFLYRRRIFTERDLKMYVDNGIYDTFCVYIKRIILCIENCFLPACRPNFIDAASTKKTFCRPVLGHAFKPNLYMAPSTIYHKRV
jgi:hypothetical protein